MAGFYNKIILMGNLTRDPELTYLPSQTPVVEFGLAVNRKYKTSDGQQREEVCFVDCRAYGRPAEIINQYMSKGRSMLVEGRLQLDTWEGKDGSRRSKHRVFVENFQFTDSGGSSGGGGGEQRYESAPQRRPQRSAGRAPSQDNYDEPSPPEYDDAPAGDDIPF